jgi:hypothetical protein
MNMMVAGSQEAASISTRVVVSETSLRAEGVERMAHLEHHVIGDIDHVGHGANPHLAQPMSHPEGGGAHGDADDFPCGEATAGLDVLDLD